MSKIKILSEHLANQIAAGEVIERPASVVKELLENSIDAGAGNVQIEIGGNGTKLIRVIDDGSGMDADDALLCLERHATSKLAENVDSRKLGTIHTLGFRGEAIPSIGSVARMSIITRPEDAPLGTRIDVQYGKVTKVHETGCNRGAVIEIRDLFGNMPARKKFLKTARTELSHIEEIVKNYGLAEYRLGITYIVNNRTILDFAGSTDTLKDRLRRIYGADSLSPLICLHERNRKSADDNDIAVSGFLLPPDESFGATSRLRLFVNNRAVKDRMMAHGVAEGLAGYLMKGRTPAGAVFVTVPYESVDVNVHPTKQEVRFQEPNRVHDRIVAAARKGMAEYQQSARAALFGSRRKTPPAQTPDQHHAAKSKTEYGPEGRFWNLPQDTAAVKDSAQKQKTASSISERKQRDSGEVVQEVATGEPAAPFNESPAKDIPVPDSLHPIGQLMDLYLLCEAKHGDEAYLVVIDQHAVHERILFENLKKQFEARQMSSQSILFPKMLELTPEYGAILEKNRDHIERFGLVVEEFGGDSYVIKAVPAVISHLAPEEILTGILMEFSEPEYGGDHGSRRADATRLNDILSSMACKAAIKAGQNLSPSEMQQLLKLMQDSRAFTHCPHGRPVVRMFSTADIKKWFHRT